MSALAGRRIVLGVCGGIAAYKAVEVCRRLVDAGAHVIPVMTEGAMRFVGSTTFTALGSEPARTSLFEHSAAPISHTQLGQSADLVVVAPATARLLSAYAAGYSHDLLTNVLIATRAPVLLCPAMHTEMWDHAAVRSNTQVLRGRGVHFVGPESGPLAGGDIGAGRLSEPQDIVAAAISILSARVDDASERDMDGLKVLISAGGTREPIDPVRFLANRSSGKQGHALAAEAASRGADVTLVTTTELPAEGVRERVAVNTAGEMHEEVMSRAGSSDVVVMAAAVADFTPETRAESKLKKRDGVPRIVLRPTVDILAALGAVKPGGQILVGFAAETAELRDNALEKLRAKNADLLIANDVSAPGVGFEHDTNEVVIFTAEGDEYHVPLTDKRLVARAVFDAVMGARSGRDG